MPGGPGRGYRRRSSALASSSVSREGKAAGPPDAKLATSEGSCPGDRVTGAAITWGFRLEDP